MINKLFQKICLHFTVTAIELLLLPLDYNSSLFVDVSISTKFSSTSLGLHCEAIVSELQLDEAIDFKLIVAPRPRKHSVL